MRRHDVQQTVQVFLFQSTHPLRGATQDVQHTKDSNPFQSTHPLRGATTVGAQAVFTDGFQSTHPLRGATRPTRVMLPFVRRNFNPRTPCGVRRRLYNNPWAVFKFQSTHPLRGATAGSDARPGTVDISIHAPLAGCDSVDQRHGLGAAISIHAPLAGCDTVSILFMPRVTYFNPRTPCGVRPAAHQHHRGNRRISIHAPLAGCDWLQPDWVFDTNISIHAPLAGCDTAQRIKEAIKAISIHAPLAGCDWREAYQRYLGFYFNPRTPCGVRLARGLSKVSWLLFQSTHPLRGATILTNIDGLTSQFQSTHPLRGATGRPTGQGDALTGFQSTHPLRGATHRC